MTRELVEAIRKLDRIRALAEAEQRRLSGNPLAPLASVSVLALLDVLDEEMKKGGK